MFSNNTETYNAVSFKLSGLVEWKEIAQLYVSNAADAQNETVPSQARCADNIAQRGDIFRLERRKLSAKHALQSNKRADTEENLGRVFWVGGFMLGGGDPRKFQGCTPPHVIRISPYIRNG